MTKVYLSHSIRGSKGDNATEEDMIENCQKAKDFAALVRKWFETILFYVPAEMDEFLVAKGIRPEKIVPELLSLDLAVIDNCDAVIFYNHLNSKGCAIEMEHTLKTNKPYAILDPDADCIDDLRVLNALFTNLEKG
jgi:hypothetical protein